MKYDMPQPQTVDVRIVNGQYVPCRSCHYLSVCEVPKNKCFPRSESFAIRCIFQCQDYTARMPS